MIITIPNKKLKQKAKDVVNFDHTLLKKAGALIEALKSSLVEGVGLAGPQIGLLERIFILKLSTKNEPIAFVNPKIISYSEETNLDVLSSDEQFLEGCLSIPGIYGLVERPWKIKLEYHDITGKKHTQKLEGYEAIIAQHEYDHLEGVLFTDRMKRPKITTVFFGSSQYSLIVLKELVKSDQIKVIGVVTSTHPNSVKTWSQKQNLPVWTDPKRADAFVVAYYGKIIPKEVLRKPQFGVINIHPSKLPKYRGPTPIQTALLNGDTSTAVTIMLMDEEIDHGPILASTDFPIKNNDTFESLLTRASKIGGELVVQTLVKLASGLSSPQPQNHALATYTPKLTRNSGKIDWNQPHPDIERMVRAYTPWPGTWTTLKELTGSGGSTRVKVIQAHLGDKGELKIDKLQVEGKKVISWEEFKRGYLK